MEVPVVCNAKKLTRAKMYYYIFKIHSSQALIHFYYAALSSEESFRWSNLITNVI